MPTTKEARYEYKKPFLWNHAVVIVYDVNDRDTFYGVKYWLDTISQLAFDADDEAARKSYFYLVANKADKYPEGR